MKLDRWREVEALFHEAISLGPGEQEAWLRERCGHDETLLADLRRMLSADATGSSTIEGVVGATARGWLSEGAPERVGAWRIVAPLASGGMGEVYLASRDDDAYQQLAAVKLLRSGADLLERFRQERQILAELVHPNIARLLDGGATGDGRPYLVLEYVDGVPITQHARGLSLRQLCELVITVCGAVTYAHRNLIVHRDIKPSNILVDRSGNPKLLDFGIAKIVGEEQALTLTQNAVFTPDYASPEQLTGAPVTTATDVYALGAVLYQLVSGVPAVRPGLPFAELVKEVCERDRRAPSLAAADPVPGDLDRIVLKAMDRDPARRYGSADQLADDLHRFLEGRPVLARGRSVAYSIGKFARRHWISVTAAAIFVTGLAVSTVLAVRQARIAESARREADRQSLLARAALQRSETEREAAESARRETAVALVESQRQKTLAQEQFERGRKLTHKFLFDVETALMEATGATKARKILVTTALEHFEQIGKEAGDRIEVVADLAKAYDKLADLQGYPAAPNLGDLAGSESSYKKSIRWNLKAERTIRARAELGYTWTKLGRVYWAQNRTADARKAWEEAEKALPQESAAGTQAEQLLVARYRTHLGRARSDFEQAYGNYQASIAYARAAVNSMLRQRQLQPNSDELFVPLANSYQALSRALLMSDQNAEALQTAEAGFAEIRKLIGLEQNLRSKSRLIPIGIQLVDCLQHSEPPIRDLERALVIDREMLDVAAEVVAADRLDMRARSNQLQVLERYAGHLYLLGRREEAIAPYKQAYESAGQLIKESPKNGGYLSRGGNLGSLLGCLYVKLGRLGEALAPLENGLRWMRDPAAQMGGQSEFLNDAEKCLAEVRGRQ
jgi:tetratricopeptide (TPR) repeat protein